MPTGPQMTNAQRAMQFWCVLVLAARTQQVLSYEMMEKMTGLPRFAMSRPLGKVLAYCQQNELPLLTSIVLEQSTGKPADPSFNVPAFDLAAEHRRVFIFDWLRNGSPTLTDFEDAAEELEAVVT